MATTGKLHVDVAVSLSVTCVTSSISGTDELTSEVEIWSGTATPDEVGSIIWNAIRKVRGDVLPIPGDVDLFSGEVFGG